MLSTTWPRPSRSGAILREPPDGPACLNPTGCFIGIDGFPSWEAPRWTLPSAVPRQGPDGAFLLVERA